MTVDHEYRVHDARHVRFFYEARVTVAAPRVDVRADRPGEARNATKMLKVGRRRILVVEGGTSPR